MKFEEGEMKILLEQNDMFKACAEYVERMGFVIRVVRGTDTTVILHCSRDAKTPFSAEVNIEKPTSDGPYRSPPQEMES